MSSFIVIDRMRVYVTDKQGQRDAWHPVNNHPEYKRQPSLYVGPDIDIPAFVRETRQEFNEQVDVQKWLRKGEELGSNPF